MKQVVLKFPNIATIAEFVVINEVSQVTVNNTARTVIGEIPEHLVQLARKGYGAISITITQPVTAKRSYFSLN